MTTPNDIAAIEAKLADIEARRLIVNERAAEAAAGLARARDAHAAHVAAVVAGTASPDAAASPLPDAEFRASIAQQAVQAVEAEYAETSELLRQARHAARVAAREADLAAAAQLAAEVDAAAEASAGSSNHTAKRIPAHCWRRCCTPTSRRRTGSTSSRRAARRLPNAPGAHDRSTWRVKQLRWRPEMPHTCTVWAMKSKRPPRSCTTMMKIATTEE